jgi:hypothetical protein
MMIRGDQELCCFRPAVLSGFANISKSGQLTGKCIPNVIVELLTFDGVGNFNAKYTESANGQLFKDQSNTVPMSCIPTAPVL